jgi:hypothetical protein
MKYLVSFLLLFCGLSAFSQADTIFVLGAEFGATTEPTDSTFTVDIIHPTDQLGQAFTASKIQVGYRLIDVFGRLYRVKSVDATGIGSSTLTVVELQDAAGPSGTGLVYRKPDNSDCIPEIQTGDIGISYALAARIANHNAVVGCGGTGGGGSGTVETIVAGTGISVDATDAANPIVTNTAPDQLVSLTGAGSVAVTGAYPNFTATGSGVTGSGTVNTIPKFTSTGVIGNSRFFDTGTNAGLGGTNAQGNWYVVSADASNSTFYNEFLNTAFTPPVSGGFAGNKNAVRNYVSINGANPYTADITGLFVSVNDFSTSTTRGQKTGAYYNVSVFAGNGSGGSARGQFNDVVEHNQMRWQDPVGAKGIWRFSTTKGSVSWA